MKLCDVNVLIYWISTDGDFARFAALKWSHPMEAGLT